jgi:sensor histidine kinase YesM
MRELSLHILDLVENASAACARRVDIRVEESRAADRLTLSVEDDGNGMPAEKIRRLEDPFVTSRTTRRVGLGLSLLGAAARRCGGGVSVEAGPGRGTRVTADFRLGHIDRAPLGDIAATLGTAILGNPHIDFGYTHRVDDKSFSFDTRQLRTGMPEAARDDPGVVHRLTTVIRRALAALDPDRGVLKGEKADG